MKVGRRILVTGGCGFLGSHITDALLDEGADVTVLDRNLAGCFPRRNVKYISGSMSDYPLLDRVLADGFDVIIHLASSTTPRSSNANPAFDVASNAASTVQLIERAAQASIGKFVFLSSGGAIYGNVDTLDLINEEQLPQPISSYGITKLTVEHYLRMYHQLYSLKYVALRVANPYGHRQDPTSGLGAITTFLDRATRGEPIEIWGDGSIVRDFLFVSDVARAVILAATTDVSGVFNVGSGTGHSINQIVAEVGSLLGRPPVVQHYAPRPFDPRRVVLDCRRIETALGWTPEVGLRDGMIRTLDWLRALPGASEGRVVNL